MHYFYFPDIITAAEEQLLPSEEAFHAFSVLRLQKGALIIITDGNYQAYEAQITDIDKRSCKFKVIKLLPPEISPCFLHIAVAPTKSMERFEWFLEKITEIGIHEITPIITEHSERTTIKIERCEKIMVAALKQSQKTYLPKIHPAISYKNFIENHQISIAKKYIAHCHLSPKIALQKLLISDHPESVLILIGPEGDFSLPEINFAETNNYQSILLANSRLRTETAAIIAGHTVQLYWENMKQ